MSSPIGPIGNTPASSPSSSVEIKKLASPLPPFDGESTIEEMAPAPLQSSLSAKTPMQREVDELCSRLFVALSEVQTKLALITDPALPSQNDLESAIGELKEIATTVHELDLWKNSLANLLRKTIVILPDTNPELDALVAELAPVVKSDGNNLNKLFEKLKHRFS